MTTNYIIEMVKSGKLPVDMIGVVTPMLAKLKDPNAAELLNYIDKHELWKRWGFAGWEDYLIKTGIPEVVVRCSTALLLIDRINESGSSRWIPVGSRREIVRLIENGPLKMSNEEFMKRLAIILVEQGKDDVVERGGCR